MRDCVGVFSARDLDHSLRNQRSRDACAEKILALVNRARLEHRKDEIAGELFAQIFDHAFRCPSGQRFLLQTSEFFFLADISAERDHLSSIIFLEPAQNDRCIEAAGVRENDFHGCLMFDV